MVIKGTREDKEKPLSVEVVNRDPSFPDQGRIWFNTSEGKLKIRVASKNKVLALEEDVAATAAETIEIDYDRNIIGDKPPSSATRNRTFKGGVMPRTGMSLGDFWFNTSAGIPFEIYQYDGTKWVKSVFSDFGEMFGHISANQMNVWDWLPINLTWVDGGSGGD